MTGFFDAITPASLGRPSGYSQGLLAPTGGRVLFVAGQTAPAFQAASAAETFQAQFEAVLGRILAVVEEAGGKFFNFAGTDSIYGGNALICTPSFEAMLREAFVK